MKRRYSLKGRRLFQEVYTFGEKLQARGIRIYIYQSDRGKEKLQESSRSVRLGISVSKRVGNACVRNRIKRRIRSICSEQIGCFNDCCDIIIQPGPAIRYRSYDLLKRDLITLFHKAGVIRSGI